MWVRCIDCPIPRHAALPVWDDSSQGSAECDARSSPCQPACSFFSQHFAFVASREWGLFVPRPESDIASSNVVSLDRLTPPSPPGLAPMQWDKTSGVLQGYRAATQLDRVSPELAMAQSPPPRELEEGELMNIELKTPQRQRSLGLISQHAASPASMPGELPADCVQSPPKKRARSAKLHRRC